MLKTLDHVNVLHVLGHFMSKAADKVYIITELLDGGELLDAVLERGSFSEADARLVFRSVLLGLQYMHDRGVIHRDVKARAQSVLSRPLRAAQALRWLGLAWGGVRFFRCIHFPWLRRAAASSLPPPILRTSRPQLENLLLADKRDLTSVHFVDFGLARAANRGFVSQLEETGDVVVGTPSYAAPEIVLYKQYGPPSDCWSAGVVLYILLSGRAPSPLLPPRTAPLRQHSRPAAPLPQPTTNPPYPTHPTLTCPPYPTPSTRSVHPFDQERNREVLFRRIVHGDFSMTRSEIARVSSEAKDLVQDLLDLDPAYRIDGGWALGVSGGGVGTRPWRGGAGRRRQLRFAFSLCVVGRPA